MDNPNQETLQTIQANIEDIQINMHANIKGIQIGMHNHMMRLENHIGENTQSIQEIAKTQHSIIVLLGDLTRRVAEIKNWSWLKIGAALSIVVPAVTILGLLVETLL